MNSEKIPKAYNAQDWEGKLYRAWEESGLFNPDICIEKGITDKTRPAFSIVLPPPNVTGTLHTGHAAVLTIEDTIVRYHRMKGDRTLWLPGTDHAAIATQSKVENILMTKEGKTRHDLGREAFLKRVEQFAQDSHDTIINQCKKMGSSLDWSREAYTLDEKRSLAVRTAFKRMYDDGLIYRGDRIVNWTVKGQSTCSDDEVVTIERQAKLYTFSYSKDFPISIATTRPETKLGDTAVAVHPEDERYKRYIGHTFTVDVGATKPLEIKIIADETVNPAFGTGAVGVTPAHSHMDFEMRERHPEIDLIQVIGPDGRMTTKAGSGYTGLSVLEAREKFVAWLHKNDLIEKEEDIVQNVGTSDRYEDVLEIIPMRQWFIAVNKEFERGGRNVTLKTLMQEAVTSNRIAILPDRFTKTYFHWIDNLRDWCISRQIWFGHRIPVWYRKQSTDNNQQTTEEEIYCGITPPEGEGWEQDPDTLDTWFSSGLWTFSTLGWPDTDAEDFKTYHPTNLLETGYDILFFWVARMILMSEYLLDTHPFDTVYLHGLVRDEQGRKMSKSLGNVIDPLTVSEQHGADTLRMALISGSTPGNDMKLSDEKIIAMRNFTNKLWNLARYVGSQGTAEAKKETDADRYLIEKLHIIVRDITRHLDRYELSLAVEELREFTWGDFASWYVEVHKVEKNDALLRHAFDTILKLWHPFMPFVTEAIHQTFRFDESELLMVTAWPAHSKTSVAGKPTFPETREEIAHENRFELIKGLISNIRNVRATYHIEPVQKMVVSAFGGSEKTIRENEEIFKRLARISEVKTLKSKIAPKNSVLVQCGLLQAFLHLEGIVDITKEHKRLEAEKTDKMRYIASIETKLGNQNFIERAKPDVVESERVKLEEAKKQLANLEHHLASLC